MNMTSSKDIEQYRMINLERLRIGVTVLEKAKLTEEQHLEVYNFVYDMLVNITDPERNMA